MAGGKRKAERLSDTMNLPTTDELKRLDEVIDEHDNRARVEIATRIIERMRLTGTNDDRILWSRCVRVVGEYLGADFDAKQPLRAVQ